MIMNKLTNRKDTTIHLTVEPQVTTEQRDYRKELWVGVAIAVARAENTRDSDKPAKWANNALAEFDKAFK
jgi:hypothetical protein